jgi:hypothetical protein
MDQVSSPIEAVAPPSLLPALGERCMACGAALARDQRYCLECGERCGEPRVPQMTGRPAAAAPPPDPPRRRRRPGASASTTLVAGVGTLVLALGVGVEIGRSSGDRTAAPAAPVRVVTVGGAGASTAAAAATAAPSATAAASTAKKKDHAKQPEAKKETVSPVITPSAHATPPPVVKIGSKGHGPGYHDGKFDGNFFGG